MVQLRPIGMMASYLGFPNSPCGRNINTMAMMMKMTVFDASG
jgi:hypothetical protein